MLCLLGSFAEEMYAPIDPNEIFSAPPDVPFVTVGVPLSWSSFKGWLINMLRRLFHIATRNQVNIQSLDRRISALHASVEDMDQYTSLAFRLAVRDEVFADVSRLHGRITSLQTQLDSLARLDSLAV